MIRRLRYTRTTQHDKGRYDTRSHRPHTTKVVDRHGTDTTEIQPEVTIKKQLIHCVAGYYDFH
jgi:hypothetical protein